MEKARFVGLFFFLLILLASQGSRVEGASYCTIVREIKGPCVSDDDCRSVCLFAGFTSGKCERSYPQCFCEKDCFDPPIHHP